MKKIIYLFVLALSLDSYAQAPLPISNYDKAKMCLNPYSLTYSPQMAIKLFTKEAEKGSARSMNALGKIYGQGLGITVDMPKALNWFWKAVEYKYIAAWYNLASIYKDGNGVPQDFRMAFECFKRGNELGPSTSTYAFDMGYMKFKGLGCRQDYEEAIAMFRRSIAKRRDLGSMYMLGICFRNGYGITANIDSARYWIGLAAVRGYSDAYDEMQEPQPENISLTKSDQNAPQQFNQNLVPAAGFPKVKHHVDPGDLNGVYTGDIIRYDWSGKYIVGQSRLTLKLTENNRNVTGEWIEDENLSASIQGELTDKALIFSNTQYSHVDHYSKKKPATFEFREAKLQVTKNGNIVYLAGNVQQFSLRLNEPEKPIYITLSKQLEN